MSQFCVQLMDILDDGKYNDIISWLPSGDGFIIHDKKRFSEEVMPIFFKQSQYSSFVRRMSRWKFALVREGHKKAKFFHPLFVRGAKHNASCIRPVRQKRRGDDDSVPQDEIMQHPADLFLKSQRHMNIPTRHITNPMEQYNNTLMNYMNQSQMSGNSNLLHTPGGFLRGFHNHPQMTPEFIQMQIMMNQANYMQQMAQTDALQQQLQQDRMKKEQNEPSKDSTQAGKSQNPNQNATQLHESSGPVQTLASNPSMSMNGNQMSMMNHAQVPTTTNPMLMQMMQMNQGMMFHGHGMNPSMNVNQASLVNNPSLPATMAGIPRSGSTATNAAPVASGYGYMVTPGMGHYNHADSSLYTNGQVGTRNESFQAVPSKDGQTTCKDLNAKEQEKEQNEDQQNSDAKIVSSDSSEPVSKVEPEKSSTNNAENNNLSTGDVEV